MTNESPPQANAIYLNEWTHTICRLFITLSPVFMIVLVSVFGRKFSLSTKLIVKGKSLLVVRSLISNNNNDFMVKHQISIYMYAYELPFYQHFQAAAEFF